MTRKEEIEHLEARRVALLADGAFVGAMQVERRIFQIIEEMGDSDDPQSPD